MPENPTPRRRWFRFSLRTLFVVMTVTCILVWAVSSAWIRSRREGFFLLMVEHQIEMNRSKGFVTKAGTPESVIKKYDDYRDELSVYHEKLYEKYKFACQNPWLPVELDPPAPKRVYLPSPIGHQP